MNPDNSMLSERLKDIREDADLTQSEMAEILKTTQTNYSRWETLEQLIPLKKLTLLCNHFNVTMDYVIGRTRTSDNNNSKHNLNYQTVGNNIKNVRLGRKLTQKELANVLNTSQSTISAYESGKTIILTAFALQIVKKYNISLDWLCGRKK